MRSSISSLWWFSLKWSTDNKTMSVQEKLDYFPLRDSPTKLQIVMDWGLCRNSAQTLIFEFILFYIVYPPHYRNYVSLYILFQWHYMQDFPFSSQCTWWWIFGFICFFPYYYNGLCHINYCLCILCIILIWSHDKNNTNIQRNALQVYNYATIYQANKFFSLKISTLTYVRILNITLSIVLSKYYASVCSQLLH